MNEKIEVILSNCDRIEELREGISDHAHDLDALLLDNNAHIDSLIQESAQKDMEIAALKARIASLQKQQESLGKFNAELASDVQSLHARIAELEGRVGLPILFDQNKFADAEKLVQLASVKAGWSGSGGSLTGQHSVGKHYPEDIFILFTNPATELTAEWDETYGPGSLWNKQKGPGPSNNNDALPHITFKTELGGYEKTGGGAGVPGQCGVDTYDTASVTGSDEFKNKNIVVKKGEKTHFKIEVGPGYGRLYVNGVLAIDAPRNWGAAKFDRFCVGGYVGGTWPATKDGSFTIENLVVRGR